MEEHMQPKSGKMLDRRAMLKLSFAGASVLALGKGSDLLAAGGKPTVKVLKEADSVIPGYAKVRGREVTWQPGDGLKTRPMKNDMVCEMASGSLDVVVDGKPLTRNTGDVWTCRKGLMISDVNKGTTPAVMRIFDLLPA
jgi:uncharacterized Zn-binding protein involved in type VI secretion